MKAIITVSFLTVLALCHTGCTQKKAEPSHSVAVTAKDYVAIGDSISLSAQQAIAGKLVAALQQGGAKYAVDFCSENAMALTDSLSAIFNCRIQRLAERTRNPLNSLKDESDLQAFSAFSDTAQAKPSILIASGENTLFYKPIFLAMPMCLQCHGSENDLDKEAYAAIRQKYPEDKATGFALGELRGMWKITFNTGSAASSQ